MLSLKNTSDASIPTDGELLAAVATYLDQVFVDCFDHYRTPRSPLIANAINVTSGNHFCWQSPDGKDFVPSNFACQQNLLRSLVGYSQITGDGRYLARAKETAGFVLRHLKDKNGLLYWGGHAMIDLRSLAVVGPSNKELVHELKNVFPAYDFLHTVNAPATLQFIRAFWSAHVADADSLEISRHGGYNSNFKEVWGMRKQTEGPFRESNSLSFISTGNDLIFSAAFFHSVTGDLKALEWAKHLTREYISARDPRTKLGAYQYTKPRQRGSTLDDTLTSSRFGDRAFRQFGPEFGTAAYEGKILTENEAVALYAVTPLLYLRLASLLGSAGLEYVEWACSGLAAFAKYGYCANTSTFRPILCDGTSLEGFVLRRHGYYGRAGSALGCFGAAPFFLAFARASLAADEPILWDTARSIARSLDLGDIGIRPGVELYLNEHCNSADPTVIFALLDLFNETRVERYLNSAKLIAGNILKKRTKGAWFGANNGAGYVSADAVEPIALLNLCAVSQGSDALVIPFLKGRGTIHGGYRLEDTGEIKDLKDLAFY